MEPITAAGLDAWLETLSQRRSHWAETPVSERLQLLQQLRRDTFRVAPRWAEVCSRLKGLDPKGQLAGEEWLVGPFITLRNLRLLESQLQSPLRDGGRVVRAIPGDTWDMVQWPVFRGETWTRPGSEPFLPVRGQLGLVLGAGNISSIGATDVLYKMFIEDQVVLLKMNPVHEALGPVLEEAFASLIERDFLKIVSGGAAEGALACRHPLVGAIHVTGSHHTYEAIRRATDRPITAELGCCSPVIVAPGRWSTRQINFQARNLVGALTTNAGFNCNAAQVLVTSRQWPQRQQFLDEVRRVLAKVPARPAYYPGAGQRHAQILDRYSQAEQIGPPGPDALPWTLVPDLDPDQDQPAFRQEAFCGTLFETSLDVAYPEYLMQATEFVNQRLWGNLSCTLVISPESQKTQPWRRAVEELRYGAIGVNVWPGLIFALVNLPWGAYPGNEPEDIQSGIGFVHNTANASGVEKCILSGPFYLPLRLPWQPGYTRSLAVARALATFEHQPGWKNALRCHWELLRGGVGM